MVNIGLSIALVSYVIGITYGSAIPDPDIGTDVGNLVTSLLGDLLPEIIHLTKGLQAIRLEPLNYIGLIALPVNLGCALPLVNDYVVCTICHNDCIVVHNTFGGKCGPHPTNPGEYTCLCAFTEEDAEKRCISPTSKETCDQSLMITPIGKLYLSCTSNCTSICTSSCTFSCTFSCTSTTTR